MFINTILYQMRSLALQLVSFNILFEFISLLHLILSEENKSMAQILFLKKNADIQLYEKLVIVRQERCIYYFMYVCIFYDTIVTFIGCYHRLINLSTYTHEGPWRDIDRSDELRTFSFLRSTELGLFLFFFMLVYPILIYKMWKQHRHEFKNHGPGFMLYTSIVMFARAVSVNEYNYLLFTVNSEDATDVCNKHINLSESHIAFQMIGFITILVPLIIVKYKKDQDIFMSFSKIDN